MDRDTTDQFRMDRRGSALIAILSLVLLAIALVAARFGPGYGQSRFDNLWLALACLVFGGLAALCIRLWHRPPVVLRIGPDGIEMPIAWRGPVPWSDVHRIARLTSRRLTSRTDMLRIDLLPGRLPPYRLRTVESAEKAFLRRVGLRIPLLRLDAPPERVVASIQRFRPVSVRAS